MTTPLLETKQLNFSYDLENVALKNINLKVYMGEKIALIGPNGAGKSTLLLCLDGIHEATSGELFLHGKRMSSKRSDLVDLRRAVGLVFQDADVSIIGPTVEADVSFGLINMGLVKDEVRSRTEKALSQMGISHLAKRPPHFLSGGQKRMLTLASVTAMKPELILLDEPTASLDARGNVLMTDKLQQLNDSGTALLVSSHNADFVYEWADKVILLVDGEIVKQGTPYEVYSDKDTLEHVGVNRPRLFDTYEALMNKPLPQTIRTVEDL